MDGIDYGPGEPFNIANRCFIHDHIVTARTIPYALPTNVRAVYYVGSQAGKWPDDATWLLDRAAEYIARGEEVPRSVRKISQKVSDYLGWLIEHELVDEDEIVDDTATWFGHMGTNDVLLEVLDFAEGVELCPWSPEPVPVILCEGRNDLSILSPLANEQLCLAFPLGGMRGGATLRWLSANIHRDAPVGYVGDWNKPGSDIEANAERVLRDRGWDGTWKRIAVTDDQARGLPHKTKIDRRRKIVVPEPSVETAAMGPAAVRTAALAWLDAQRPTAPDADEAERAEIVAHLRMLRDVRF